MILQLKVTVTLTFDLVTSKTICVILLSGPTTTTSLKILSLAILQLVTGNDSTTKCQSDSFLLGEAFLLYVTIYSKLDPFSFRV